MDGRKMRLKPLENVLTEVEVLTEVLQNQLLYVE
jgi:hypothetical protein